MQRDDSNRSTTRGATPAPATPTRRNNRDRDYDPTRGATTATAKLTGLTGTCTEKLYVVAITLVVNKIVPPGIAIPAQALASAFTVLSQPGPALPAYTMSFPTMRTCIATPQLHYIDLSFTLINNLTKNIFSAECVLSTKNDFRAKVLVLAYKFHDR